MGVFGNSEELVYRIPHGVPAPSGNGEPGEPFIMYHTTGVTRGIVIAYRDDNDPRSDECAR